MTGDLNGLSHRAAAFPSQALLAWFSDHGRDLPWRGAADPYLIWLSEVMLHQTRVDTVIPYFHRFRGQFPTVAALAEAPMDDILRIWEGLGYYRRAHNLHRAAQIIVQEHGGTIPQDWKQLRALPGIGDYSAAAILSIAFGQDFAAVDGNVARVLARWYGCRLPINSSAGRRTIRQLAQQALPAGEASAFNQALMDLGALVCQPRATDCAACPVQTGCIARNRGLQQELPVRNSARPVPHYDVTAALIVRDHRLLITQRPAEAMLGGLWEFPGGKQQEGESLPQCLEREIMEELALPIQVGDPFMSLKHAYTHFRITLHTFWCKPEPDSEPVCLECSALRWVNPAELGSYALSAADRRIANALLDDRRGDPPRLPALADA